MYTKSKMTKYFRATLSNTMDINAFKLMQNIPSVKSLLVARRSIAKPFLLKNAATLKQPNKRGDIAYGYYRI